MSECPYKAEIESIIIQGNAMTLVDTAKKIAKTLIIRKDRDKVDESSSVSTSQIRNIYGSSKKIQMALNESNIQQMYSKLVLLKPKMAYANGRFNKKTKSGDKIPGFRILTDCLQYAIDNVKGDFNRMQNFFDFFEAILAYHKAEGGK